MIYSFTNISLLDILKKYTSFSTDGFTGNAKKGGLLGPCPIHKESTGSSFCMYDKTETGEGWDWVCFGQCHTGGKATNLLVQLGLADNVKAAREMIERDFNIQPPKTVSVDTFSDYKGISKELLKERKIVDIERVTPKEHQEELGTVMNVVAIPYFNLEGEEVAVKQRLTWKAKEKLPKYLFSHGSNTIYGLDLLDGYDKNLPLYITEGETDCLTLLDIGKQAIGVPGANAWRSSPEAHEIIGSFEKIILVMDNDQAGEKLKKDILESYPDRVFTYPLPNGFDDVNDWLMFGYSGFRENFKERFDKETSVPATPDTFVRMVVDLDDSEVLLKREAWFNCFDYLGDDLAVSLWVEDFKGKYKGGKRVLGKIYNRFSAEYSAEKHKAKVLDVEDFYVENNCYYKTVYDANGAPTGVRISNFIMHHQHTLKTSDGFVRKVVLENEHGFVSKPLLLLPKSLSNINEFNTMCLSVGNFTFTGSNMDLLSLITSLLSAEVDTVDCPDKIGRIGDVWLMGGYGIDSTGEVIMQDDSGLICLDGEQYMTRSLNISEDNNAGGSTMFPNYPLFSVDDIDDTYLKDVANKFYQNIGSYEAWLALGFTVAGWHRDEIYRHKDDSSYPIFFIQGKRNSGKTYLSQWLMSAYGFNTQEGYSFASPTLVGMSRLAGYYSSLPQWFDDYRNNARGIKGKNSFLLGAYNRQGASKGVRSGFGVRAEPFNAFLLISGEDSPADSAVASRCCMITANARKRDDSLLPDVVDLVDRFPAMGLKFLQDKQAHGSEKLLAEVDYIEQLMKELGIDGRLAKNVAVFAGSFLYAFGHVISEQQRDDFISWLSKDVFKIKEVTEETHVVYQFFSDFVRLESDAKIRHHKHFKVADGQVSMWFPACYAAWEDDLQDDVTSRVVMRGYIKDEPFYIEDKSVRLTPDQAPRKCLVIDYKQVECEEFVDLCKYLEGSEFDEDNLDSKLEF